MKIRKSKKTQVYYIADHDIIFSVRFGEERYCTNKQWMFDDHIFASKFKNFEDFYNNCFYNNDNIIFLGYL